MFLVRYELGLYIEEAALFIVTGVKTSNLKQNSSVTAVKTSNLT
jgi:hypothetical protein